MGIIVTFIALLIVTFITYYGQNAGNFVLSIDEDLKDRNVYMSETVDFINPTAMLQADAVYDARDITYTNVSDQSYDEVLNMFNVKLHILKEGNEFDLINKIPFEEEI